MIPHLTRCHGKHYTLQGMKKKNVMCTLSSDFANEVEVWENEKCCGSMS